MSALLQWGSWLSTLMRSRHSVPQIKLRTDMNMGLPIPLDGLWFIFEQMLATVNMSFPNEVMKHAVKAIASEEEVAKGAVFEVVYEREHFSEVTALWHDKFPETARYLEIDDSEAGCRVVLHPKEHADCMVKDCLPYELGKNVYKYAMESYPGASEALVRYWRGSSLITYGIIAEWIAARAASLEPELLIFKSAVEFWLGHHAQSYIWYWVSRLRIVSDTKKNQASGVFCLDAWGSDLMKKYLSSDYSDWEKSFAQYPLSLQFALKQFLECPAQYNPAWVSRVVPEVRSSEIIDKSCWKKIDYEIAVEMSEEPLPGFAELDKLRVCDSMEGGNKDMPMSVCRLS